MYDFTINMYNDFKFVDGFYIMIYTMIYDKFYIMIYGMILITPQRGIFMILHDDTI